MDDQQQNQAPDQVQQPDIPVDQELAQRVTTLYEQVDQVLADLQVPQKEKDEVQQNLMSAVAADLLTRLGTRLTDEQKKEFAQVAQANGGEEPDLNAVAAFFRGIFSQEELVNEVALATESVLTDFIAEMSR